MSELNEQINELSELEGADPASWGERLSNAVSDYEAIGVEDAAGLGL